MPAHGAHRGNLTYHWKHGWIPLDHAAALSKAHGSHAGALHYMPGGKHESVDIRRMSDEHLANHLGDAADNEHAVNKVIAELDRRDRVGQQREKRKTSKEAARSAHWDSLIAAGEDPERAYSIAYGVDETTMARQSAIASLRSSGHTGRGLDELVRSAHAEHVRQSYLDAENVTRGHMVNKAGLAAGVHGTSLFTGPESRARKYASEELLSYWQQHGRLTPADFKASVLGGALPSVSSAAFI